jgi:integrase
MIMSAGTILKTCACTDPDTGRRLRTHCPKLRRGPDGPWSATHGVWAIQLELPTPDRRPRRQFRRSGFDTRPAAQAVLDEARALLALAPRDRELTLRIADLLDEHPRKLPLPTPEAVAKLLRAGTIDGVTIMVNTYLDDWLTSRTDLSPGTRNCYESHLRLHIKPNLAGIGIHALKPIHIQDIFTRIDENNQRIRDARTSPDPHIRGSVRSQRVISDATKQRIRATIRSALADAIKIHRLIDYNPASPINLPTGTRPPAEAWTDKAITTWKTTGTTPSPVMVWTPTQAGAFLDYAETHDIIVYAIYALITVWGPRRGEACGLRDIDVDLDHATITIRQQRTAVGYQPIVRKVKSKAGARTIMIDPHTAGILRTYLAMRARWQLANGPDWPGTGFFFVQPNGQPWHPDLLSDRFKQLTIRAGLPPVRLHDLRHCAASYLKLAGADMKTIQYILGHSSIVITMDTYTLLFNDLERTITNGAADLIHKQRQPKNEQQTQKNAQRPNAA